MVSSRDPWRRKKGGRQISRFVQRSLRIPFSEMIASSQPETGERAGRAQSSKRPMKEGSINPSEFRQPGFSKTAEVEHERHHGQRRFLSLQTRLCTFHQRRDG